MQEILYVHFKDLAQVLISKFVQTDLRWILLPVAFDFDT